MGNGHIRIVLRNQLSEIQKLRLELERFSQACGLPSRTLFELNLILEEVVANVISYAYEGTQSHEIVVEAHFQDDELVLEIEDDGRPFNPLQGPAPDFESPLERRKVGGLGMHLVREFTNNIEYGREDGKNRLVLRKKIRESSDPRERRP